MTLSMIEIYAVLAVTFTLIAALLRYTGLITEKGLGTRLLIVAAAFMIIGIGFGALSNLTETIGSESLAEQIDRAGVYLGYSVGGVSAVLSGLLIALKSLIGGDK